MMVAIVLTWVFNAAKIFCALLWLYDNQISEILRSDNSFDFIFDVCSEILCQLLRCKVIGIDKLSPSALNLF